MSHIYRHYHQIKIVNHDNNNHPKISGVEEIWCDGKKQVHYLSDQEVYAKLQDPDFPFYLLTDAGTGFEYFYPHQLTDWLETEDLPHRTRYINPNEVIIEVPSYPLKKSSNWRKKFLSLRQSIKQGVNKIKNMAQRLPNALKVAWQELKR
ncbi:hypothetical protein VB715_04515 [Crocosphaera sp. UHCC 0190]|uniref:hypothetical protein n=1 Tax=Crocosphaera sp. UHCC 0190 TaxID=3110246 RepID=UPI002B221842|nr:hypothetical protein [Crocosphaera sp. UHCC 0190]MEA5509020.1 hypothetical protein [Crocosphaera sp. UHCC 0190]